MTLDEHAIRAALLATGAYTFAQADELAKAMAHMRRTAHTGTTETIDWIFEQATHPISIFDYSDFLTPQQPKPATPQLPARQPKQRSLFR